MRVPAATHTRVLEKHATGEGHWHAPHDRGASTRGGRRPSFRTLVPSLADHPPADVPPHPRLGGRCPVGASLAPRALHTYPAPEGGPCGVGGLAAHGVRDRHRWGGDAPRSSDEWCAPGSLVATTGWCVCVCVCGVFGCMYVSIRRVCMRCARSPPPPCQPQELHTCRPPRADDAQTLWDVYVSEWSRTGCTATARARREKLRRWQHMVRRRQHTSDSNHVVVPLERPRDRPVAASENGWGGGTETYIRFFASVRWSDAPRVLEMFAAMHAIIDRFRATGAVRRARTLLLGTLCLSCTAEGGAKGSVRRRTFAPSITYAVPSFRAPARLSSPRWMG